MALDGEATLMFLVNVPCIALLDQNSIFRERVPAALFIYTAVFVNAHCVFPRCSLSLFLLVFRVQILFKALSHTFKCLEIDTEPQCLSAWLPAS